MFSSFQVWHSERTLPVKASREDISAIRNQFTTSSDI